MNCTDAMGQEVGRVVEEGIRDRAGELRTRELPDSCLLRLVCDSGLPTQSSSPAVARRPARVELPMGDDDNVFRKKGQAWVVRFNGGPEFILLPSKGAAYLHLLLARQGQESSAITLACQVADVPDQFALGDAGNRSDKEAREAYRARYNELCDEFDQAKRDDDEAALGRLTRERSMLTDELKDRAGAAGPSASIAGRIACASPSAPRCVARSNRSRHTMPRSPNTSAHDTFAAATTRCTTPTSKSIGSFNLRRKRAATRNVAAATSGVAPPP
jgi:hypothetical protein